MSAIQKKLAEATEVEPSKRQNETITNQEYMKRLALGVQSLPDDEWNKLDKECQDWFNKAADAIESKTDIPDFPDMEPAAGATTGRRRGSAAAETPFTSKDAKKGDTVTVVTKRGKEYTGKVTEADDQGIILDDTTELDHDKIDTIKLAGGANKVEEPAEPEVSDTVTVVTKRGKTITANITELTDTDIVLVDAAGEIHEFGRDRLESIVVKVKNAGKQVAATTRTASKSEPAASTPKSDEKPKRATAAANGGVSITTRIRELIADKLDAKKEDIAVILKKESLEFKQATLDLTFSDMHKIIGILREKKIIK